MSGERDFFSARKQVPVRTVEMHQQDA